MMASAVQRLNLTLECENDTAITTALLDLGYGSRNEIFFALEFGVGESAFAHYNAAVQAVAAAVAAHPAPPLVYLQFTNVEAIWTPASP